MGCFKFPALQACCRMHYGSHGKGKPAGKSIQGGKWRHWLVCAALVRYGEREGGTPVFCYITCMRKADFPSLLHLNRSFKIHRVKGSSKSPTVSLQVSMWLRTWLAKSDASSPWLPISSVCDSHITCASGWPHRIPITSPGSRGEKCRLLGPTPSSLNQNLYLSEISSDP